MKIKILKHNLIELLPQTDVDAALIELWSTGEARLSGSTYNNEGITGVRVEFKSPAEVSVMNGPRPEPSRNLTSPPE